MNKKSKAASILGKSKSERKAAASRENGKLGGKPRESRIFDDIKESFDCMIERVVNKMPVGLHDSTMYVYNTMDMCKNIAKDLFGDNATKEDVYAIYNSIASKHSKSLLLPYK